MIVPRINIGRFNTQPPEGGCAATCLLCPIMPVSTHSRPKAAGEAIGGFDAKLEVSTHSRPKAADLKRRRHCLAASFNTQPPEGGCAAAGYGAPVFNVSTHSRPKAAETMVD